jgi:Ca2+-binding RTX toxin-like protein
VSGVLTAHCCCGGGSSCGRAIRRGLIGRARACLRPGVALAAAVAATAVVPGASTALPRAESAAGATNFNVVFERETTAGNADVIITTQQGKPQHNLTSNDLVNDSAPAFSPNGKRIAFTSDRTGHFALWTMNADGGDQRLLTKSGGSDVNPIWSPNGQRIAFASNGSGNWDIWVVNANGKGRRNLTHDAATELDPAWSPTSSRVIYDRIARGRSDLWAVSARGGTQTDLTPRSTLDELDPSWSKTGRLAFDAVDKKGNYDVYVKKPGKGPTRLTTNAAEDSAPVWSPDGTRLLFVSARTGDYEIFEMNANGSRQHDVSRDPNVADVAPNWARPRLGSAQEARRLAANFPCGLPLGTLGDDNGVSHPIVDGDGGTNRLCGRAGDDIVHGEGAHDLIDGGGGNDKLYGDGGNDTIYARAGTYRDRDTIWGGAGSDIAYYDPNKDVVKPDVEYPRTTS